MAWDAGGGLWWAATAEIFKTYAIIAHLLKHLSDTIWPAKLFQKAPLRSFIVL